MKILRTTIEISNSVLGYLKARQRLSIPSGFKSVRLNLGCGLAVTKGWINIDGSLNALVASMPSIVHKIMYGLTGARQYYSESEYCRLLSDHIFIHHDLSYGIPFQDNTADYIYSSHFLEHLYKADAINLLRNSYRVLKPGGIIRVSIPDLEHAISMYPGNKLQMLNDYFFVERGDSHFSRHKYMYDFQMLSLLLQECGFHEVTRCEYRKGLLPDVDVLDNRPDDSLFVEAIK